MTAWLDGDWLEADAAGPSIRDRGFLLGDGLFETLCHKHGRLHRAEAHLARLRVSCLSLGLACPLEDHDWQGIIGELMARQGLASAAIRITVTAGTGERGLARAASPSASCLITVAALAAPPASLTLATSDIRRAASSFAARHKTLSYIDNVMARRQAQAAGADMALLLDTDGHLSGADCANVFWMSGGAYFTPSLDCAVLPGTVRAALLDGLGVTEGRFSPDRLFTADQVFLTNALMGAVPVVSLDGEALPACLPDAVTRVLA
tara:strand:- start:8169 stop:8960 length:792 start_codon:yes stop_codon:yes gene_type:complete